MFLALAALFFLSIGANAQELLPLPPQLPVGYGVLGLRVHPAAAGTLEIAQIHWLSPAAATKLQPGDRLLGIAPYRLQTPTELERYIQSVPPDTHLTLRLVRDGTPVSIIVPTTSIGRLYAPMGSLGRPPGEHHQARHAQWSAASSVLETKALALIERQQAAVQLEDLKQALHLETKRYAGDYRLQDIHYGLHNPLKISQLTATLAAGFPPSAPLKSLVAKAAQHLDLPLPPVADPAPQVPAPWLDFSNDPLSQHLVKTLYLAGTLAGSAFAQLDENQFRQLRQTAPRLLTQLNTYRSLEHSRPPEVQGYYETLNLAKSVDLAPLFLAAIPLADLASPQGIKTLRALVKKADLTPLPEPPKGFSGHFLLAHNTPWGWLPSRGQRFQYLQRRCPFYSRLGR